MSTPSDEAREPDNEPALDFDPYRFGAPEHPVPPEYAPPGYKPPPGQAPPPDPSSVYPPPFPNAQQPSGYPPPGYPPPGYPSGPGYPPPPGAAPGYQGYPPGPYQQPGGYAPVPPQYSAYPPPGNSNSRATASLVLGIVSIVLCFLTLLDLVAVVLAIVFGVGARRQAIRDPRIGGKTAATAGIVCGIVGAVLIAGIFVFAFRAASHCNAYNTNSSQWKSCVEHHLHLK